MGAVVVSFKQYEYFLEIAKHGSVTKAAESIMISQSALSKYLRRLEDELGAQLLDRSTIPLKLTPAGEIFLRYVTQGAAMEKVCVQQIAQLQDNLTETLRIGIGMLHSSCILPHFLPLFRSKYPYVKIEVIEDTTDTSAEALQAGRLDVGILSFPQQYPFLNSTLLADMRILLVGNQANPLVKHKTMANPWEHQYATVNIQDFSRESFLLSKDNQGFTKTVQSLFESTGFLPTDITYIDNIHTRIYTVANGDYISFVPEIALHTLQLPDNLRFFQIGSPPLTYPIGVGYAPDKSLSNAASLFIQIVQQFFRSLFSGETDVPPL